MRKFLAFMFGLIFGVVFLLGTFGLALYSSITVVHPNEIYTDIENYLGDLGDVSLLQAYYNILDLYQSQTGNLTDQKLYSVGDFLEDNHISTTDESGQTVAFGIVLPKELLDAPLFEYFNTNVDANGHTGVQRALKQIKLSAVPSIVNTFATPGENGEPVVSDEIVAELDNYSVFDLVYGENQIEGLPNIVANLAVVMENITLADLIPAFRATTETDNLIKNLLLAVGKAPVGKLIADLTGDSNILGMFGEDGALAEVGKLTVADILGNSDPLISSLVGNIAVADFVNEHGEFALVDVLDCISVAGLLGIVKRPVDIQIPDTNITPYYETKADDSQGALIWSIGTVEGKYYISLNAENDAIATTWYEGQLVCTNGHEHKANCYDYMWYAPCKEEHDHTGEYTVGAGESATAYLPVATTSLNYTIAGLKLSCLFDETGAINFDNLITQFDKHTVDQILDELLAHNDILDKISNLLELDGATLSDILAEGGIDQLLANVTDKPIADILDAFGVTGLDFVTDLVGNMTINQLIEGGYENIALGGIIGLVKRDVTDGITDADGNLLDGILTRNFVTTTEEGEIVELCVAYHLVDGDTLYYLSTNYNQTDNASALWYEGQLKCDDDTHTAFEHHTKACFEYVLYQACTNEDTTHIHADEDAFCITTTVEQVDTTTYYVKANALFKTLGNMTVGGIIEGGFNTLLDQLLNLRLADLFDMLGVGEMEGILETLSKFTISELMEGGYTNLTIGDLLGYKRYLNTTTMDNGSLVTFTDNQNNVIGYVASAGQQLIVSTDAQMWYNGKLGCNEEHTHTFDCYEYLWYGACQEGCVDAHDHIDIDGKNHSLATGIFALLVDMTIGDITNNPNSLLDKVFQIQLKQLLGDDLEGLMATIGEFSIEDLMDPSTLNGIGIGDILNYIRKDVSDQVSSSNSWTNVVVDNGSEIVKHNTSTNSYAYLDGNDGKWYNAQLHCKDTEHQHNSDCFGYVWYAKCDDAVCSDHDEHTTVDSTRYGSISGLYGVLADLTIGSLTGGENILEILTNRLTLGDIFGDNIPEMLASLKDTPIAELSGKIETTQLGNLLGFVFNKDEDRWEKEVGGTMQPVSGIENKLAYKTISDLKDFGTILEDVTLGDVLGDNLPSMLNALADTKIPDLASTLTTLEIGHLLGFVFNKDEDRWEKEVDGTMQPLTGIEKVIAENTIDSLKNFDSILSKITLGDVLGDNLPSMLSKLKDTYVTEIGNKIDSLVVGDFLGYTHVTVDVENASWNAVTGVDGLYVNGNGEYALVSGQVYYIAELTCNQQHAHGINCYQYKWYTKCEDNCNDATHLHTTDTEGNAFVAVVGITSKLAGKTINQLSDLTDLMNDLTLNDVFGEGKVPTILKSIADEKVSNLQQALNSIYVGDFLGYEKGNRILVCDNDHPDHVHIEDMGNANCCYQKKLACNDTSHTHSAMCYIECYEWWELACHESSHNHSFATTPECYKKVAGITGKIANERLDTLSDMSETIKSFTLRDVLGEDIPGMLKGIADTPIGQLDNALDNLYLGEILQYTKHQAQQSVIDNCTTTVIDGIVKTNDDNSAYIMLEGNVWYDAVVSCTDASCQHNDINCYGYIWYDGTQKATGITAKLANEKVSELGSLGDTIQTFSLYDVLGDSVPSMLESIKYQPINNLSNSINNIYVGEFLGYTKEDGNKKLVCDQSHEHTEDCYHYNWLDGTTTVEGFMAKIANKKVSNLGSIGDDIKSYTFAEIMGTNSDDNALIKELYNTPVGEMGSKMNDIKLGTAMGYYRKVVCDQAHTHTDSCYEVADGKVVWYTDANCTAGNQVGAPQSAFVNSTLKNIGGDISNITLGELIQIDDDSSSMLQALQNTPINNIAGAIDGMALGTSMGFVRRELEDTSYTTEVASKGGKVVVKADNVDVENAKFVKLYNDSWCEAVFSCNQTNQNGQPHEHDADCYSNADCYGYVWYQKCTKEHNHQDDTNINGANYQKVGGLNAKMSNLTVGNMGGQAVVDIVVSLSMRDMMDSGILNFSEEEKFKLSILFACEDGSQQCNLFNYLIASMTNPSLTAENFFRSAHGTLTEEELIAHRDEWQYCTLTDFITTLLGNFDKNN